MVFVLPTFIQYSSYIYTCQKPFFFNHIQHRQLTQLGYLLFENICIHFRICHLVSCNTIPSLITSKHTRLTVTRWFVLEGVRLNCTLSLVKKKKYGGDSTTSICPKSHALYVTINISLHTHTNKRVTDTMNISHGSHMISLVFSE